MSKTVKAMITKELQARYEGVRSACLVDLTGMNVQEQESLRAGVRAKSGRLEVVKNSLARRAFQDGPLSAIGNAVEGPCALVTSSESIIDLAKYLVAAAEAFGQLRLKQAIVDGDPALVTIEGLSKMKGWSELLGEVALLVSSPARTLAACLRSPQSKIVGCLETVINKGA